MTLAQIFDFKKTPELIGYENKFIFFKDLIEKNKLPKTIMLSGCKGIGKSTFINHLMYLYFDKDNYSLNKNSFNPESSFSKKYSNNLFDNIVYLNGENYKNVRVEDIRKLKVELYKTPHKKDKRFIILDDIEVFNLNSLNALLKIIEEPNNDNYFILINNTSKPLIETIKSRCIEFKFLLNKINNDKILNFLIQKYNHKLILDKDLVKVSPGNFLKFNYLFNEKLKYDDSYSKNCRIILDLYKKEKDNFYKELIIYFTDYYLQMNIYKKLNREKFIINRKKIIKSINEFFSYNLSQNTLMNSLDANLK